MAVATRPMWMLIRRSSGCYVIISRRRRPRARRSTTSSPTTIIKKYGAEMFRLWVASTRVPLRHPVLADDPRRSRRVVSQAAQHRAVPPRQPQGLRSGRARSLGRHARRRSLHARAARRCRDARAQGVRGVRAARRAPPARRLRHRRHLGALRRRHEGPPVLRRGRLARRGAPRRS